jgi:hypothetical protein
VKRHSLGNTNGAVKNDAPPPPSTTGIANYNGYTTTPTSNSMILSHQVSTLLTLLLDALEEDIDVFPFYKKATQMKRTTILSFPF